jgi:uncharacterized membrane protein YbhN (UPF0104 family)
MTVRRWLTTAFTVVVFAGAVWVLYAELRHHSLVAIVDELRALPAARLALAVLAAALGYLALAGHDALSLRLLGRALPFRRIALASFIGYAFANSLPLAVVTGASVRRRLYSAWGLSGAAAAEVVAINTVTYAAGLLGTAGLAFTLQPVPVPGFLGVPLHTARPLGVLCWVMLAGYLLWSARARTTLRIGRWRIPAPTFRLALAQVSISALDWILSGTALFALLPGRVPFLTFLAVYLLGQLAALIAQVPGGLGVFEAVVLWCLRPAIRPPAIFGALFAYRIVYFLLPLALAAAVWGGREAGLWWRTRRTRSAVSS